MAFTVGQIVELDAWGFGEGALLQTGDRGTVVVGGRMNEFSAMVARVLWHRTGIEADMVEDRLRIYVPRVTQRASSVNVLLALQTVLREEQPHAITELRRDLAEAGGTIATMRVRYDALRLEHSDLLNMHNALGLEYSDLLNRVEVASHEVRYASGQLLQHGHGVAVGQPSVHRVAHAREALEVATRSLDGNDNDDEDIRSQ